MRAEPLNCEVRLPRLVEGDLTPNERFYIRSHFPVPVVDPDTWRLRVRGRVRKELSLPLREVRRMPEVARPVTLECAGNGRSFFQPAIEGEQWALGAVSTAGWNGVSLAAVLGQAGVVAEGRHLIFRGAEGFERGLSLDEARDTLLVHGMNGAPLPVEHGFPLRAIVPGWYAVASVKWLNEIEVTDAPFAGYFQAQRYVYGEGKPVTQQRVRSLIIDPEDGARVGAGRLVIRGLAWSGSATVTRIEVRVGDGQWHAAEAAASERFAWRPWRYAASVAETGATTLRSRATDETGATQPEQAEWNRLGYGNNSIQTVTVEVG